MKREHGFSLMETLAALALLALLLLGVTAALQTMTTSTRAGIARTERLDEMRAAQSYLRRTLAGAVAYPWALSEKKTPVVFKGEPTQFTLVAPGPGYLASQGLQIQTFALVDKGDGPMHLDVAFASLPFRGRPPIVPADPEVLLGGVASGHFVYSEPAGKDGQVAWLSSWPHPDRLPAMIGIELELKGGAAWPSLAVPLRMDPAAVNGREGVARLVSFGKP